MLQTNGEQGGRNIVGECYRTKISEWSQRSKNINWSQPNTNKKVKTSGSSCNGSWGRCGGEGIRNLGEGGMSTAWLVGVITPQHGKQQSMCGGAVYVSPNVGNGNA